ncbi:MAG: prepilin peptidase [Planctomycetaceae bacterium]
MPDLLSLLATLVFTLYVFAFGACFGSFLNVIVWRIPRGLPIAFARSHCPHCNTMIPGSDNIPIVGWLRLRGRCRFCRQQISMRYLVVETGVALLFAGLFLLIVVSQGATLPQHGQASQFTNWLTDFPNGWTLQVFLHQCVLGYALLAILLMDQERSETPWSFSLVMAALHLGLVCWNPAINQLDQLTQRPTLGSPLALASLSASLNYSLSGGVLAARVGRTCQSVEAPLPCSQQPPGLTLAGSVSRANRTCLGRVDCRYGPRHAMAGRQAARATIRPGVGAGVALVLRLADHPVFVALVAARGVATLGVTRISRADE